MKAPGSPTKYAVLSVTLILLALTVASRAEEDQAGTFLDSFAPLEIHGFGELRAGYRVQNDPYEKDMSVMESRLQLELSTYNDWADFKYKGDVWADGVTEQGDYDARETWVFARPTDFMDVKLGRQVLTWGTGELVFLNDLFPKDWQSFFIGRDMEYLKAPSDAAKLSLFTELANVDVVYTPQFDSDRYITGEYVSYWNAAQQRHAGRDALVHSDKPDRWFRDDEAAVRLYKNVNNYEGALYGYWGFWKKPAGRSPSGAAAFPDLHVYGASVRGQVGPGIGNVELAYYQSADDESGSDPLVDNSQMRYLVGYTQELGRDLTAGLQHYVEQMLDYGPYHKHVLDNLARDRYRHVITLQVTQLMMSQNLELSLSSSYSPSDEDAYLRPSVTYKYTDNLTLQTGANVFFGDDSRTFFAQFEDSANLYTAVRYSF